MIEILKSKDRALIKLDKLTKGSWVNVISPSSDEIKTLKSKFNIPEEVFSSLKDVDEIPTIERYKDLLFILIKTPQKVEKVTQGKYITIPLGILLTPDYFITICFQDNEIISKFKNSKIYSHKKIQNTLKLLLFSAKNYLKYLKEINKEINNAQKDLEKSMKNKELFNLLDIEKGLIYCSWKSAKEKFFYPLIHKKVLKAKKIGKAFYLRPRDVYDFHQRYYQLNKE